MVFYFPFTHNIAKMKTARSLEMVVLHRHIGGKVLDIRGGVEKVEIILYIAALVAAIALLVIAVYLGMTLKSTSKTMDEVAKSLEQMTGEVKGITDQAEKLMEKTNNLLEDINGKVAKVDPVFDAVGDIGVSLLGLSQSVRELATLATNKVQTNEKKIVQAVSFSNSILAFRDKMKANKVAKQAASEANEETINL